MRLLIRGNKIIGTATDDYAGDEETITATADFDINLTYKIIDGKAVVQAPQVISMRQARLVLLAHALLDKIESAITTSEAKIWWEYSINVERNHPLVCSVLKAIGQTESKIDALFIEAAGL
jgi:hypothetical protein